MQSALKNPCAGPPASPVIAVVGVRSGGGEAAVGRVCEEDFGGMEKTRVWAWELGLKERAEPCRFTVFFSFEKMILYVGRGALGDGGRDHAYTIGTLKFRASADLYIWTWRSGGLWVGDLPGYQHTGAGWNSRGNS